MCQKKQVVVITGAFGGIGKSIVKRFDKEGSKLVLLDLKYVNKDSWIKELLSEILIIECDITKKSSIQSACKKIVSKFGKIDVLINCAGILPSITSLEEIELDEWKKTHDVNLTGTFLCAQTFGKVMIEGGGGSIVNIASMAGLTASPKKAPYSSSKAAVIMLTQQIALEWADKNIRANAVCPGFIETTFISHMFEDSREREKRENIIPMGRLGTPDEVANIVYFLTTPESAYINGDIIKIDGGYTLTTMPKIDSKGNIV